MHRAICNCSEQFAPADFRSVKIVTAGTIDVLWIFSATATSAGHVRAYENNFVIQTRSLLLADEHPIVGDALIALLRERADPMFVLQVYSLPQLKESLQSISPCVVVGEVLLAGENLLDYWTSAMLPIKHRPPLIVFSREQDWCWIGRAAVAGAYDFVSKNAPSEQLMDSIRRAANGDSPDPSGAMAAMKRRLRRPRANARKGIPLTTRELQVLSHVAIGMSNRQIGCALGISTETAKEHVQNILRKLNVNDRTHAAMWAAQHDLLT